TAAWLEDPGERDLTAHVDFTSIRLAAEAEGLTTLGLTDQTYFLLGLLETERLPSSGAVTARQREFAPMEPVKKSRSDVVRTFRSARHGRPKGLHYSDSFTGSTGGVRTANEEERLRLRGAVAPRQRQFA